MCDVIWRALMMRYSCGCASVDLVCASAGVDDETLLWLCNVDVLCALERRSLTLPACVAFDVISISTVCVCVCVCVCVMGTEVADPACV